MSKFFSGWALGLIFSSLMSITNLERSHEDKQIEARAKASYTHYVERRGWKQDNQVLPPWPLLDAKEQEKWKEAMNHCGHGASK